MHSFFRQITAAAVSAVMTVSTFSAFPTFCADDETAKTQVKITFELPEGASAGTDDDGNPYVYDDIITKPNSSIFIPLGKPKMEGATFSAWTADGIYAYEPNDVFRVGTEDVVLKPAFYYSADKTYYQFKYEVEVGGEIVDTSDILDSYKYKKNRLIVPSLTAIMNPDARQIGWTDGEHEFLPEQKFLMPEHDVTLKPIWHFYHSLKYYVGDVDGVIGANYVDLTLQEGSSKELAEYNRFSRKGYAIAGWHNEYDGKDYKALETYVMPDADVVFTAIWKPVTYTVVFNPNIKGSDLIKIKGETGTSIKAPEAGMTVEGKTFGGWSYEGKVYQPGDDFLIEGAAPGVGIMLKAVWNDGTADTTTATTSASATSSATTTTVTSSTTTQLNTKRYDFTDVIKAIDDKSVTFALKGTFNFESNYAEKFSNYNVGDVISISFICSENQGSVPTIVTVNSNYYVENEKSSLCISDKITEIGTDHITFEEHGKFNTNLLDNPNEIFSAYKVGDKVDIAFSYIEIFYANYKIIDNVSYISKSVDDGYSVVFINKATGELINKGNVHFKVKARLVKGDATPFTTDAYVKADLSKENPYKIKYDLYMDDISEYEYNFYLSEFGCDDNVISVDENESGDNFTVVYCSVLEEEQHEVKTGTKKVILKDADTNEIINDTTSIYYYVDNLISDEKTGEELFNNYSNGNVTYSKDKDCFIEYSDYSDKFKNSVCEVSVVVYLAISSNYLYIDSEETDGDTITVYLRRRYGDANVDGQVDLADVVLIMQSLVNPDKYGLNGSDPSHITETGLLNADVIGNDGVTNNDALTIQKYKLDLIEEFHVVK